MPNEPCPAGKQAFIYLFAIYAAFIAMLVSGCATTQPACDKYETRILKEPIIHVVSPPPRGFGGRMKKHLKWVQFEEKVCVRERVQ